MRNFRQFWQIYIKIVKIVPFWNMRNCTISRKNVHLLYGTVVHFLEDTTKKAFNGNPKWLEAKWSRKITGPYFAFRFTAVLWIRNGLSSSGSWYALVKVILDPDPPPVSDPTLKQDKVSKWKIFCVHNRFAARHFRHFEDFLRECVCNERRIWLLYVVKVGSGFGSKTIFSDSDDLVKKFPYPTASGSGCRSTTVAYMRRFNIYCNF